MSEADINALGVIKQPQPSPSRLSHYGRQLIEINFCYAVDWLAGCQRLTGGYM